MVPLNSSWYLFGALSQRIGQTTDMPLLNPCGQKQRHLANGFLNFQFSLKPNCLYNLHCHISSLHLEIICAIKKTLCFERLLAFGAINYNVVAVLEMRGSNLENTIFSFNDKLNRNPVLYCRGCWLEDVSWHYCYQWQWLSDSDMGAQQHQHNSPRVRQAQYWGRA